MPASLMGWSIENLQEADNNVRWNELPVTARSKNVHVADILLQKH